MEHLDASLVLAVAALVTSVSRLVWAFRRRPDQER